VHDDLSSSVLSCSGRSSVVLRLRASLFSRSLDFDGLKDGESGLRSSKAKT